MKPCNLSERKRCQIRRQTKDEDSIYAHRIFGVRFFYVSEEKERSLLGAVTPVQKGMQYGKKTVYF